MNGVFESLILLSKNSQTAIFKRTPFSHVLLDSAENWVEAMSDMGERRSVDGSDFEDLSAEQRQLLNAFFGHVEEGGRNGRFEDRRSRS